MTPSEALALLELSRPYTEAGLRSAWRKALMTWHPDRLTDTSLHAEAASRTQSINEAFETLLLAADDHGTGKVALHREITAFWQDRGFTVRNATGSLAADGAKEPFADEATALLQHGDLAAICGGPTVQIRILIDGDPLSDYTIARRFPAIHQAAMRLRRHAGIRNELPSALTGILPDQWIPFRLLDTIAIIHVVLSTTRRARLFRKNFGEEARINSHLYHVHTRLAVIDLESQTISHDPVRPGSGERGEIPALCQALFAGTA